MPTRFSPHSILVALSGPHKWVTFGAISNSYDIFTSIPAAALSGPHKWVTFGAISNSYDIFTRVWDQHIIYGNDT